MTEQLSRRSPASALVLEAVVDLLLEHGYEGLTPAAIVQRADAAGPALGDSPDIEALVVAALDSVELFPVPPPTGSLRDDLGALMRPWRGPRTRDELVLGAVLSASGWRPRLKAAVFTALDRPLAQVVGTVLARATADGQVPTRQALTLSWILRGLLLDRLRSGPRSAVDIDQLVEFLLAGFESSGGAAAPAHRGTTGAGHS